MVLEYVRSLALQRYEMYWETEVRSGKQRYCKKHEVLNRVNCIVQQAELAVNRFLNAVLKVGGHLQYHNGELLGRAENIISATAQRRGKAQQSRISRLWVQVYCS